MDGNTSMARWRGTPRPGLRNTCLDEKQKKKKENLPILISGFSKRPFSRSTGPINSLRVSAVSHCLLQGQGINSPPIFGAEIACSCHGLRPDLSSFILAIFWWKKSKIMVRNLEGAPHYPVRISFSKDIRMNSNMALMDIRVIYQLY